MAYVPDMGVPAPAPTWMGGHSSIEQNPLAPLIQELLAHLLGQARGGQANLPLDPTFNLPRPYVGGPPRHPGALTPLMTPQRFVNGGGIPTVRGNFPMGELGNPGRERISHVFDVQRAAKQLARQFTNSQNFRQPFLRRV